MKLTTQVETEVNLVYNTYWKGLLSADLTTYANVLDENFKLIGSTESEMFFKSSDAIQFLDETADQVAGNIELRNRIIKTEAIDSLVLITEQSDTYVKINGSWTFYGKVRCSSILEKKMQEWKFIQMHLSFPDSKTEEGQTIGLKKVEKENLELRDAIKRRTIELENKTRELEIEAALERVRAASMAMRDSSALSEIIYKVYVELTKLDAQLDRCFIMIVNPENKGITWWMAGQEGLLAENGFFIPMNQNASHLWYLDCWNSRKKKWQYLLEGKEKLDWDRFGFSKTELVRLPEPVKKFMSTQKKVHLSGSSNEFGSLVTGSFEPLPEEQQDIISRFTSAFNQAYIRFLDLQKAEAQTKEALIETALERVRSRTMAMHNSQELKEVAMELRKQMGLLGQKDLEVCAIHLYDDENSFESWSAMKTPGLDGEILQTQARFPNKGIKIVDELKTQYSSGNRDYILANEGEKIVEWFTLLKEYAPDLHTSIMQSVGKLPINKLKANWSVADFAGGALVMVTYGKPDAPSRNLLRRLANVFEQAYIRFLDLQKAEAQSHEAQIELALERVRARTMAMHTSDELPQAANLLFQQIQSLGMPAWSAGYCIWDEDKQGITLWMSSEGVMQPFFHAPLTKDASFIHMREAFERKQDFHIEEVGGKALVKHYKYMRSLPIVGKVLDSIIDAGHPLPTFQIFHCVYFSKGFLLFITYEPVLEAHKIFKRFGKVFDQTYTRFLDLQKAEAQLREAQIEAALERVRSKTMAMHKSEQLPETAQVLFKQFAELGKIPDRISIGIIKEELQVIEWWVTDQMGIQLSSHFDSSIFQPTIAELFTAWKEAKDSTIVDLSGEALKEWIDYVRDEVKMPIDETKIKGRRVHHAAFFSQGLLLISAHDLVPNETMQLLVRFAKVFSQTYTRFLDLQKAEAQAREAQIEAALERVRSRTMAMQRSDELSETAAVLFNEFKKLSNEELIQVTIGIYNEAEGTIEFRATSWAGGGEQISHPFILSIEEPTLLQPTYAAWKKKRKSIIADLTGEKLEGWINYRNANTGVNVSSADTDGRRVITAAFFSKGHLSISSPVPLQEDTVKTLERFASVFDSTYTRFNDLLKAEAQVELTRLNLIQIQEEKQKAEAALLELQITQKQLIQSEKMASLGELTAGIAHEIQNQLNFVNNFSEVSNELVQEIEEEREKKPEERDEELVSEILNDIKQNLEKINHHGKRADAIVKGMLQHSRSSSAVKEPTDINKLADEYLRLAYHGLRAKDKSFNATMNTEFDETIGNINIIPQDIGRVILNLITNAFYATNEKSKQGIEGYEPTVVVATKKVGDTVLVSVKDNGNGIPQKVLDKIFQPFFTTKPAGQGTGLGLSLAYDIVKAHGGELKVETKENEETLFIIHLPI